MNAGQQLIYNTLVALAKDGAIVRAESGGMVGDGVLSGPWGPNKDSFSIRSKSGDFQIPGFRIASVASINLGVGTDGLPIVRISSFRFC